MKLRSLLLAKVLGSASLLVLPLMSAAPALSNWSTPQEFRRAVERDCEPFRDWPVGYLISKQPGSPINIRDGASTQTRARHIGYARDFVDILDLRMGEGGYCWYRVRFQSGATGWVRGDFFEPYRDF